MWWFSKYFIRSSVFFAEIIRVMARISDTIEDIISSIDIRRLLTPNAAIIATIATNIYPNNGSRLLITNYLPSTTSSTWGTSPTRNNHHIGLGHHRACSFPRSLRLPVGPIIFSFPSSPPPPSSSALASDAL